MQENQTKTRAGKRGGYVVAVLTGLAVMTALLAAEAILMHCGKLSPELSGEIVIAVNFIGAAAAGLTAAARRGSGVITAGAITGAALMLILLLVSLAAGEGRINGPEWVRIAVCSVFGGLFGGVLCLRKGNKRFRKKRR